MKLIAKISEVFSCLNDELDTGLDNRKEYFIKILNRVKNKRFQLRDPLRISFGTLFILFPKLREYFSNSKLTVIKDGLPLTLHRKAFGVEKVCYLTELACRPVLIKLFRNCLNNPENSYVHIDKFLKERELLNKYFCNELADEEIRFINVLHHGQEINIPVIISNYHHDFIDPFSFEGNTIELMSLLQNLNIEKEFLEFLNQIVRFNEETDYLLDICGKNNIVITNEGFPTIKILDTNGTLSKSDLRAWVKSRYRFMYEVKNLLENKLNHISTAPQSSTDSSLLPNI